MLLLKGIVTKGMATELHLIPGGDRKTSVADIIFVHGLKPGPGNQKDFAFSTWGAKDENSEFWGKWLREDLDAHDDGTLPVTTWVLEYDSASSEWFGHAMPIYQRAINVLDRLNGLNIGNKPIIFICHSMGGLVAKEVLRQGLTGGIADNEAIAKNVRGIAFLSTPHTGADFAAFISNLQKALRLTPVLSEMSANSATMLSLSEWYRNNAPTHNVETLSYGESQPQMGVMVVDQTSANPHIQGTTVTLLDASHSETVKPANRTAQQCLGVLKFVSRVLRKKPALPFS